MKPVLTAGASALSLLLAACSDTTPTDAGVPDNAVPSYESSDTQAQEPEEAQEAALGTFGVALENMDTSVDPGDDFFRYVNGTWLDETELPADRSAFTAFNVLGDRAEQRVRGIIERAAASDDPTPDEARIAGLYNAYMDVDAIEAVGLTPVQADLDRVRSASTREDIIDLMADRRLGTASLASIYVGIDAKQNDQYRVTMSQSGLGLPTPGDYSDDSERAQTIRAGYVDYLTAMLTEAGLNDPRQRAEAVMAFETELASGYWEREQRRDRDLTYNKMSVDALTEAAPGLMWDRWFDALGLGGETEVILEEKSAIEHAADVFARTDVAVLRDYITASLLGNNAFMLPARIDEARFDFYGRILNGRQEQRPRWKRAVSQVNSRLGFLVGKIYVDRFFPPDSKAQMDDLIENLRETFREGLDGLEWMGDETKEQAQYKLANFRPKIGYPDVWETYDGLEVDGDDLYGTIQNARLWAWEDDRSDLGQPIDRERWGMTPQRVNAYYSPPLNEIVFPAAILDAPFFDPHADPAVNYGGIGAVIGHEMGHGFDDQGRKVDGDGRLRDWWTEADAARFEERAARLAAQYSEFEPLPGEFMNGRQSLGENIGDLTGVNMAYRAYRRSLNGEEPPVIDGFTGDQRFFMAWGQIWASLWRDEALSQQIKSGVHSPGMYRVNGIVRNVDAWYDAFDVQPEDELYTPPEERVSIW
ncbi:MAG: M13 family metallopeptidase [Pseudomonadota bacterium]